jgi:hypothetical protein
MVGKKLGVDRWIPLQICIFSVLSFAQFWMQGRSAFLALRFLIAFFQGGFIPDCILYLSYYCKSTILPFRSSLVADSTFAPLFSTDTNTELPSRLALFWCINYFADMLTGELAVQVAPKPPVDDFWLSCDQVSSLSASSRCVVSVDTLVGPGCSFWKDCSLCAQLVVVVETDEFRES